MTDRAFFPSFDRFLGVVGLFLILVVTRLADRGFTASPTVAGRLSGFVARRAIDGIAVIGWLVDRLPLPARHIASAGSRVAALSGGATSV